MSKFIIMVGDMYVSREPYNEEVTLHRKLTNAVRLNKTQAGNAMFNLTDWGIGNPQAMVEVVTLKEAEWLGGNE